MNLTPYLPAARMHNAARALRQAEIARTSALERELDRNLAARRAMRPQRQAAAHKGWDTRRGK
jgi:hypothetical protein